MRALPLAFALAACGSDSHSGPRVIPGGGVGDGAIDGHLNVFVIDSTTYAPIEGATIGVGCVQLNSDATGLAVFTGVKGPQEIGVSADRYTTTVWSGANGTNVTVPLAQKTPTPEQATLSGSIANWSAITVPAQDLKAAIVLYSQTTRLGDAENNLPTPAMGNICTTASDCKWTLVSRTGTVTLAAAIVDRSASATTVIGWATKSGLTVANGVAQSGIDLAQVQAGDLQTVTIDLGTPPAGLTQSQAEVGIDLSKDEVLQLPVIGGATSLALPKPSAVAGTGTYRLTALAQTQSTPPGESAVIVHGVTGTALSAGTWLVPPSSVAVSRIGGSYQPVDGAKLHQVVWTDSAGVSQLNIVEFDDTARSVSVPDWVTIPAGPTTAKVTGLAVDFDVMDFSLDADRDKILGLAAQTVTVP